MAANSACPDAASSTSDSCTYSYTGSEQVFDVPTGVTAVTVQAIGAAGGGGSGIGGGGQGASVTETISVPTGDTSLYVEVGGTGFGGGGASSSGAPGGGASDVQTCAIGPSCTNTANPDTDPRLIVAGGGGGGGESTNASSSDGGMGGSAENAMTSTSGSGGTGTESYYPPRGIKKAPTSTAPPSTTTTTTTTTTTSSPPPPVAMVSTTAGQAGLTYRFSAGDSHVTGAQITTFRWTIDDHVVGLGPTLTYTFPKAGQAYLVTLTITDSDGQSTTKTFTITPRARAATARLTVHFATNSGALSASARHALVPLRTLFANATRVKIAGYCAAREAHRSRRLSHLSAQRAHAILRSWKPDTPTTPRT